MEITNLNFIKEIISKVDIEVLSPKPFTTKEKLLATERIITSYQESQAIIPDFRQKLIDEKIKDSIKNKEMDYSDIIERLDEDINFVKSYDNDDIYLLYMTRESTALFVRSSLEIDKISKRHDQLLEACKSKKCDVYTATELQNTTKELEKLLEEYHVSRILTYFFKTVWNKKTYSD